MKHRLLISLLVLLIFFGSLSARDGDTSIASADLRDNETDWENKHPVNSPSARWGHAMAYDSTRDETILFGGLSSTWLNDTWKWDGTNWTQIFPENKPTPRLGHAMAFDNDRGVIVLFGGYGNSQQHDDTWEWDGTNWTQAYSITKPDPKSYHALAYDSARKRTVLFGADYNNSMIIVGFSTWEWDGNNWEKKYPALNPVARVPNPDAAMVFDSTREVSVLLTNHSSSPLWEWNGINWIKPNPTSKPESRDRITLAFDSVRGLTVLFGGSYHLDDTWEWDGTTWINQFPANKPSARFGHAMAYDSERKVVILFGGIKKEGQSTYRLSDTWQYSVIDLPDTDKYNNYLPLLTR